MAYSEKVVDPFPTPPPRLLSTQGDREHRLSYREIGSMSPSGMDTLMRLENDKIQETSHKRRPRMRRSDGRVPKKTVNDLTCNEADVDGLLSAGELT